MQAGTINKTQIGRNVIMILAKNYKANTKR